MAVANFVVKFIQDLRMEIFILILFIYLLWRGKKSLFEMRPNIPGPFPWPLIGNAISLGSQPHLSMQAMAKKYGDIFLMKLGSIDVLVLNSYESIKEALGRQGQIFQGRPIFDSFSKISQGKGIVFNCPQTQGEDWKRMKRIVVRLLHRFTSSNETRSRLASHIRREAIEMVFNLNQLCSSSKTGAINPETTINVSIANIVCALMFGHRYEYTNKEFQDLVSLNRQFGDVVGAGSQIDVMPWITIFPKFKTAMKTFDFLTNRLNEWMKLRTDEHKRGYVNGVTRDVVDTFIEEGIKDPSGLMKDDIIMALTTDVFGAGQDTLSTTIQWVLIYLMYFKECQKKIHAELDSVLGCDRLPELSERNKFPYLEAFMHELFRHSTFTSSPIPHSTIKKTVLNGYHIPENMLVFVNQYAANHDSKHWAKPDEFIPERFLDQDGHLIKNPHDKYLLFSHGPRKCPGDELSRLLLMHFVATVLTLCKVEEDPLCPTSLEGIYNLSIRPKSLVTKLHIRNPVLMQNKITSPHHLSCNIPTVTSNVSICDPATQSSSKQDNAALYSDPHSEFSDSDELLLRSQELQKRYRRRSLSRKFGAFNDIINNNHLVKAFPGR